MSSPPSPSLPPEARQRLLWAGGALLALYALWLVWHIGTHPRAQWDFLTYELAVQAWQAGSDPYAPRGDWPLPFVYPPWTLPVLAPLTLLPPLAWLGLKVLLAGALLALWRRLGLPLILLGLVALIGLHAPLYRDLLSGNVNLLEVGLIWAGLHALYKGEEAAFVGLIVLASVFKLTPVLLLGLLLFGDHPRRFALLGAGLGTVAVAVAGSWLLQPELFQAWLANVGGLEEFAPYDVSTRAMTSELRSALSVTLGSELAPSVGGSLYLVTALVIAGLSVLGLRRADLRGRLLLGTAAYALVLPRLKDYALLLLVPAAVAGLQGIGKRGGFALLLGLLLLNTDSAALTSLPGLRELQMVALNYLPWLAVLAIWVVNLVQARRP
jgi:hypothetical protein